MKKQDILENQVNFAYLALGSNLGDKKNNLNKSIDLIQKEGILIKKRSKFYSTKSWPNENFPNFINSVIFIGTKLNLEQLFFNLLFCFSGFFFNPFTGLQALLETSWLLLDAS